MTEPFCAVRTMDKAVAEEYLQQELVKGHRVWIEQQPDGTFELMVQSEE